MGVKGISAIAGAVLVAMAFEPTTIMVKIAYGLFGAAAGDQLSVKQLRPRLST